MVGVRGRGRVGVRVRVRIGIRVSVSGLGLEYADREGCAEHEELRGLEAEERH